MANVKYCACVSKYLLILPKKKKKIFKAISICIMAVICMHACMRHHAFDSRENAVCFRLIQPVLRPVQSMGSSLSADSTTGGRVLSAFTRFSQWGVRIAGGGGGGGGAPFSPEKRGGGGGGSEDAHAIYMTRSCAHSCAQPDLPVRPD